MQEIIENKFVIEMVGNPIAFYVSDVTVDGNPSFTAYIDNAMKYNSEARAMIDIEKIKAAKFTMELTVEPCEISYKVGRN